MQKKEPKNTKVIRIFFLFVMFILLIYYYAFVVDIRATIGDALETITMLLFFGIIFLALFFEYEFEKEFNKNLFVISIAIIFISFIISWFEELEFYYLATSLFGFVLLLISFVLERKK